MGPVEVVLSVLRPFTEAAGITDAWLVSSAMNVIVAVSAIKRALKRWFPVVGWWVWLLGGVVSVLYGLTVYTAGWAAVILAVIGVFVLSVVQLAVSGRIGNFVAGGKMGGEPLAKPGRLIDK